MKGLVTKQFIINYKTWDLDLAWPDFYIEWAFLVCLKGYFSKIHVPTKSKNISAPQNMMIQQYLFLSFHRRLSDVLKRKKPPKRPARKANKGEDSSDPNLKSSVTSRSSRSKVSSKEKSSSGSSSKMSFLPSLNPRSWGKLGGSSSSSDRPLLSKVCTASS